MSKPTSPSPTLRAAHQRARWLLASCLTAANIVSACAAEGTTVGPADSAASARHTYYSGGVHNDKGCLPPQTCIHRRKPGEPSDPHYPQWWTSKWTMYRVFSNYDRFPPPWHAGLLPILLAQPSANPRLHQAPSIQRAAKHASRR